MPTANDISVVIPHYYARREPNLRLIVDALQAGTVRPREILIWANEPVLQELRGVSIIAAHRNVGAQARFLAALAALGQWIVFLDNDVSPESRTLETLLDWAQADQIHTLEGRLCSGGGYREAPKIYGHSIAAPVRVQLSLGRGEIVWRRALPRLLQHFPFDAGLVMDDLWFSAAAARQKVPIFVMPAAKGESSLRELPMYGEGLCLRREYYAERDAALSEVARAFHAA